MTETKKAKRGRPKTRKPTVRGKPVPQDSPPPPAKRGGDLPDHLLRMEVFVEYIRRNWSEGFSALVAAENARRLEVAKVISGFHCTGCDRYGKLKLSLDKTGLRCEVCHKEISFADAISESFRGLVR